MSPNVVPLTKLFGHYLKYLLDIISYLLILLLKTNLTDLFSIETVFKKKSETTKIKKEPKSEEWKCPILYKMIYQ